MIRLFTKTKYIISSSTGRTFYSLLKPNHRTILAQEASQMRTEEVAVGVLEQLEKHPRASIARLFKDGKVIELTIDYRANKENFK